MKDKGKLGANSHFTMNSYFSGENTGHSGIMKISRSTPYKRAAQLSQTEGFSGSGNLDSDKKDNKSSREWFGANFGLSARECAKCRKHGSSYQLQQEI